ncbi:MAG: hypothetical protein AAF081_08765 [Actinomycetota bacterium]
MAAPRAAIVRSWVVLWLVLQVGTIAAIFVVDLVPDDMILDQVAADLDAGRITTEWPSQSWVGSTQDTFGECFLLVGGYDDGTYGTLETITGQPSFGACEPLATAIEARGAGETIVADTHFRYWHGLTVVARPFMALTSVVVLRVVAGLVLVASLASVVRSATSIAGPLGAAALLVPVVATGDLHGMVSVFHHPLMLAVGLATIGWVLSAAARSVPDERLAFGATGFAALYNVVDLFNFVPGVWLVATGAAAAARPLGTSLAARRRSGLAVGVGWVSGYGVMWLSLWVWAAVATSPTKIWDDVVTKILFRIGGDEEFESAGFGVGLLRNLEFWAERPGAVPMIGVLIVAGALALWSVRRDRDALAAVTVAVAPAVLVVPWMLGAGQHHENHPWFEYRSFPMLLGLGLFAVACARSGRFSTGPA